ncbi:hypothetical protein CSB37_01605 [bacterium DOLZORAL124_38_8]|nr:MAG: hypothetical protein CSB37_01605 [bacterium DOLZORAL124_38_8]
MLVAVIGSAGRLGKCFCKYFANNKIPFLAVNRTDLDITNKKQVEVFFANNLQITHVVLCAAYTKVDLAENDRNTCFAVNVNGVQNIVDNFSGKLIHFSTDFVFDGTKEEGYEVDDERHPINVYGESKKAAEDVLMDSENVSWANLRISSLLDENSSFVQFLSDAVENEKTVTIWSTNKMIPTIATELVETVTKQFILADFKSGHYHLPSKNMAPLSWYDLAVLLFNPHKHLFVPVDEFKTTAKRPQFSVLN